jgi:hypothetical protein
MNADVALNLLAEVMDWDMDRGREEFAWLRVMSRLKYDAYEDFRAGLRFIESLAGWLQQFQKSERETAYRFVRDRLVYIGAAEMQHMVELAYPETIRRRLIDSVAHTLSIPSYRVWADQQATTMYWGLLRRTLLMGLSDGAKLDAFRRANSGIVRNEQVVMTTQNSPAKWQSVLKALRKDTNDPGAKFAFVYLIDDFVASGTNVLRKYEGIWEGKLIRFWDEAGGYLDTHFENDWVLCVHHYVATAHAVGKITQKYRKFLAEREQDRWFREVEFSYGTVLSSDLPVNSGGCEDFLELVDKYYDEDIETKHSDVGGSDLKLGFANCALPLVLEHNTPNNSIGLIWAESEGKDGKHAMRPLFRRRQRYS